MRMRVQISRRGSNTPAVHTALRKVVHATANAMKKDAHELTGTQHYSLKALAAMGHPYGRLNGRVKMRRSMGGIFNRPWVINKQSGQVARGWKQHFADSQMRFTMTNVAPHFVYLQYGTRKMIKRNIMGYLVRKHKAQFSKDCRAAVKQALLKR